MRSGASSFSRFYSLGVGVTDQCSGFPAAQTSSLGEELIICICLSTVRNRIRIEIWFMVITEHSVSLLIHVYRLP